jgi:type IV pilus assembly protein PilE
MEMVTPNRSSEATGLRRAFAHLAGGKRGFTLIELLIALIITGILAALAITGYNHMVVSARQAEAQRQLIVIRQAEEMYRFLNGAYTATTTNLTNYGWVASTGYYTYTITSAGTNASGSPTFTARAQGNIDSDATLDTWTIDQDGTLTNTVNDVTG